MRDCLCRIFIFYSISAESSKVFIKIGLTSASIDIYSYSWNCSGLLYSYGWSYPWKCGSSSSTSSCDCSPTWSRGFLHRIISILIFYIKDSLVFWRVLRKKGSKKISLIINLGIYEGRASLNEFWIFVNKTSKFSETVFQTILCRSIKNSGWVSSDCDLAPYMKDKFPS